MSAAAFWVPAIGAGLSAVGSFVGAAGQRKRSKRASQAAQLAMERVESVFGPGAREYLGQRQRLAKLAEEPITEAVKPVWEPVQEYMVGEEERQVPTLMGGLEAAGIRESGRRVAARSELGRRERLSRGAQYATLLSGARELQEGRRRELMGSLAPEYAAYTEGVTGYPIQAALARAEAPTSEDVWGGALGGAGGALMGAGLQRWAYGGIPTG